MRGLTRKQAGELAEIDPNVLRTMEQYPGQDTMLLPVVRLARIYGTTVENLLIDPDPTLPAFIPPIKKGRPIVKKP